MIHPKKFHTLFFTNPKWSHKDMTCPSNTKMKAEMHLGGTIYVNVFFLFLEYPYLFVSAPVKDLNCQWLTQIFPPKLIYNYLFNPAFFAENFLGPHFSFQQIIGFVCMTSYYVLHIQK